MFWKGSIYVSKTMCSPKCLHIKQHYYEVFKPTGACQKKRKDIEGKKNETIGVEESNLIYF